MPSFNASTLGLLERIKRAEDGFELQALLVEGEGYENASEDTRRRWKRAAEKRRRELHQP